MKTTLTNEELVKKCKALISALYKNPGAWTMRVPVDVINYLDVILSELVDRFKRQTWFKELDDVKAVELFQSVYEESDRAKAKFGEQLDIPSVRSTDSYSSVEVLQKEYVDASMKNNTLSWAMVAAEELAEVIGCKDEETRRVELVQLMSVCARWIAAIDWQTEYNKETKNQIGE